MQKKNKANLALLISATGAVGTIGIGGSGLLGGLVHHGFLAATIGGLADWFAVTAIFHKPLGISYRTDILRRNRGRLMESLVNFASEDLLSTEHIMNVLRKQDMAKLLVDYLEVRGGRERVRSVVDEVMLQSVNDMDTHALAVELAPAVRDGLAAFPLETIACDIMNILAEERHSRRILHSLMSIGTQIIDSPAWQEVLEDNIHVLLESYERGSTVRAFLIGCLGLTDEKVAAMLTKKMHEQIDTYLNGETESYASVKAGFETMLRRFSTDETLLDMMTNWKEHFLGSLDLVPFLEAWLNANVKGEDPFWLPHLNHFVDQKIDQFVRSEHMQHRVDQALKDFAESELKKHHSLIPGLIQERLNELSDEQLIELTESKVQDDLQMIRINGAVVGSMVGMGLFLMVWVIERICGV